MEHYLTQFFKLHGDIVPVGGLYHCLIKEMEKPLIELTLKHVGGNQLKTAQVLGINRNTLRRKMKELGIEV